MTLPPPPSTRPTRRERAGLRAVLAPVIEAHRAREACAADAVPAHEAASAQEPAAASTLAGLLDLRGSVALAATLARAPAARRGIGLGEATLVARDLEDAVADIRSRAERAIARWALRPAGRAPASREAIGAALAPLREGERRLRSVADAVWTPIVSEATLDLASARREIAALRRDELGVLASDAEGLRILALACAVEDAMVGAIDVRLGTALELLKAELALALVPELAALPAESEATVIDRWLSPDGAVRVGLARVAGVVREALALDARRLLALIEELRGREARAATSAPPREPPAPEERA